MARSLIAIKFLEARFDWMKKVRDERLSKVEAERIRPKFTDFVKDEIKTKRLRVKGQEIENVKGVV